MAPFKKINQWEMNTYGRKIYRVPSWVDWMQSLFYNHITEAEVRVSCVSFPPLLLSVEEISSSLYWFSLFLLPLPFGFEFSWCLGPWAGLPREPTSSCQTPTPHCPFFTDLNYSKVWLIKGYINERSFSRVWTLLSEAPGERLGRGMIR